MTHSTIKVVREQNEFILENTRQQMCTTHFAAEAYPSGSSPCDPYGGVSSGHCASTSHRDSLSTQSSINRQTAHTNCLRTQWGSWHAQPQYHMEQVNITIPYAVASRCLNVVASHRPKSYCLRRYSARIAQAGKRPQMAKACQHKPKI